MKKNMLILMLLSILSLSGCTRTITKTEYRAILPPDSLLTYPCVVQRGFATPRELAILNLKNSSCIEQYIESKKALNEWKIQHNKINNQ